jgi:hypothetical protein
MPGEGLTHGPRAIKKARGRNHRFSRIIRHSLRNGVTAYSALFRGTGLSCSRRRAIISRGLASASGGQDHTPLPSASALFVRTNDRAHRQSVHRIPLPTSVTIAKRPSGGGGTA